MHISDDEILRLSEACSEYEDINKYDLEKLMHIKDCDICYDKFCAYLALIDATSEVGIAYAIKSRTNNNLAMISDISSKVTDKMMAAITLVKDASKKGCSMLMEIHNYAESVFHFDEPVLAVASRGINNDDDGGVLRAEDVNYDSTFVVFDNQNGEIYIQIDKEQISCQAISVYIVYDDGTETSVDMQNTETVLSGMIDIDPLKEFSIEIREGGKG